jgi:hypothetical protein
MAPVRGLLAPEECKTMKITTNIARFLMLAAVPVALAACSQTTMEETSQAAESAADDAAANTKAAGDAMEQSATNAGNAMENAADKAGNAMERAGDKAEAAAADARQATGEKLEETGKDMQKPK